MKPASIDERFSDKLTQRYTFDSLRYQNVENQLIDVAT